MKSNIEKLKDIIKHKENVKDNLITLGLKYIEMGDFNFGRDLIIRAYTHDLSKFTGIEFEHLFSDNPDEKTLKLAAEEHSKSNTHHPEYYGHISKMTKLDLAELSSDWLARAREFGKDIKDYIHSQALKRYDFSPNDECYKEIIKNIDLLCDKPFKQLKNDSQ